MPDERPNARTFVITALAFELSLGAIAIVLGLVLDVSPASSISWNFAGLAWGAAATLPLWAGLWLAVRYPIGPLANLKRLATEWIVPMFASCGWLELALISAAAGLGEELLFRGFLQGAFTRWTASPVIGLVLASLLFGLAHPMTWFYAVLAGLIGLYLGWLWIATDNLFVPITTHALYDFGALVYLVRESKGTRDDKDVALSE